MCYETTDTLRDHIASSQGDTVGAMEMLPEMQRKRFGVFTAGRLTEEVWYLSDHVLDCIIPTD